MSLSKSIPLLLFFLGFSLGFSQKITLKNSENNAVVPSVVVYNNEKTKSTISDFDGVVDLSNFDANEIINFSHISYTIVSIIKLEITPTLYLYSNSDELSEVVLSVSRSKEKKDRIAVKIAVITQKQIQKLAPQTSADLLAATPGLRVQKSQGGGGSLVIRGFEANRVLLVVDNVRMNNAIYRSGHLQNVISISPYSLSRTEVVFGPSSVIYGSDALGGVVHFYTKTPKINAEKLFKGNTNSRYSSVNNEFTQSVGAEFSLKKWGSHTAVSISDFSDSKMGKNRKHGYGNWGLVPFYSDNNDVVFNNDPVYNEKPYLQKNTGYNQIDLLQKINIKIAEKNNLIFNFQFSESSNINRFDKLTELKNGSLKFAEWYYGPQKRMFLSTQYQFNPDYKWLKEGTLTAAFQKIKESRIKRKYNNYERTYQKEKVHVFSLNADFKIPLAKKRDLSYGVEFTYNDVFSNAYGEILNVVDNQIIGVDNQTIVQSRYPDGGSSYATSATYANYRQDINSKMTLNTGARFTYTSLKAGFVDQTYISLPETNLKLDNSSFTANLGLTYRATKLTRLNMVVSSGFRSPNIDDVGKIREKSGLLTVPNINLKPEFAYNGEFGITKFIKNKRNQISINGFYTLIKDYISRASFAVENDTSTLDEDTVVYDGEIVNTIANVNGDDAYIFGGTIDFTVNPIRNIFFKGNATITKGKTKNNIALPSISPLFSSLSLEYNKGKVNASISYKFTSKKNAADYSPNGEDNLEQSPLFDPNPLIADDEYYVGTPSWSILNTSIQYQVNKTLGLQVGVDNIFDIHYKEFASGINSPGRNVKTSLVLDF